MSDKTLRLQVIFGALDKLTTPLKRISAETSKASRALKAAGEDVRKLNAASRDLGALQKLREEMRGAGNDIDQARRREHALLAEIRAAVEPTAKLRREFERARETTRKLEQAQGDQVRRFGELKRKLADTGVDVRRLSEAESQLKVRTAAANDEFAEQKRRLEALQTQSKRLAASQKAAEKMRSAGGSNMARGGAIVATGGVMAAPFVGAMKGALDYESKLTDIAQKTGATREQARAMSRDFIAMAPKVNQKAAEVAEGFDQLVGLGMDNSAARAVLEPLGRAATAYKAEFEDLAKSSQAAFSNLKIEGTTDNAKAILDAQAYAGKKGAVELKDMSLLMPGLTARYQMLGQTGLRANAGLAAGLQVVRNGAKDAEEAGTNLTNLLAKINSQETANKFKKFGIDLPKSLKRAAAEGKDPIEAIIGLVQQATKGDGDKLSLLFEDMQAQSAVAALVPRIAEYRQMREDALKAGGTVDRDFTERMRDGAQQVHRMQVNVDALGLSIASGLGPQINSLLEKAADVTNKFADWAQKNPKAAQTLFTVGGGAAAAVVGLGALRLVFGAVMFALGPFIGLVTRAGPLLAKLGPFFLRLGSWIAKLGPLLSTLGSWFMRLGPVFGWLLRAVGIVARVLLFAGEAIGVVVTALDPIVWVILAIAAAAALLIRYWGPISRFFVGLWARVREVFAASLRWLLGASAQFREAGAHIIGGLADGIRGALGGAKDAIMNAGGQVIGWFKEKLGIKSPSRVFAQLGIYTMDGLAQGLDRSRSGPLRSVARTAAALATAANGSISPEGLAQAPDRRRSVPLRSAIRTAAALAAAGGVVSPAIAAVPPLRFASPKPVVSPPRAAAPSAAGGGERHYHFHPPEGADEARSFQLWRQWMAEHERQQQARARSRLGDYGD